jgi:4-amino-4-deoxy-L-arabinose transferase-like glycosyltransferase
MFYKIFFLSFLIRIFYLLISYKLNFDPVSCCDWSRYNEISDNIINGNFNLDTGAFIVAPIFPYFVSLIKIINYDHHILVIQIFQIFLSSISVIFLMKISDLFFSNKLITIITGLVYCIYPITFWYVFYLGQETIFQSLFIISIYYLSLSLQKDNFINIGLFSLFFALAFLTKSHIILFYPFVFLIFFIKKKKFLFAIKNFTIFTLLILLIAMPHGISNKKINNFYVISTTGLGFHFLIGHNDDFYKMVTNPPPKTSEEYKRIWSMDYNIMKKIDNNNKLNHQEKDRLRLVEGINWIKKYPKKTIELFIINSINFLKPGFNKLHQDYLKWLISFLISFPVYVLAYMGIIKNIYKDFSNHTTVLFILISMFLFSTIFYSQNRFRVITIEPFYLIYGSYYFHHLIRNIFKINYFKKLEL